MGQANRTKPNQPKWVRMTINFRDLLVFTKARVRVDVALGKKNKFC